MPLADLERVFNPDSCGHALGLPKGETIHLTNFCIMFRLNKLQDFERPKTMLKLTVGVASTQHSLENPCAWEMVRRPRRLVWSVLWV
jgi:hypothetical protein